MKKKSLLLSILVVVTFASCTTFKVSGVQVTREIPSYQAVGDFEITVKVWEFLGTSGGANLFNATSDKMDTAIYDAIQREIQKYTGDAAVNVTIEYRGSAGNVIVNGLTVGILAPAQAIVTGTIVKYSE